MEKIFNQKNCNNFVWSPLGTRGNIYKNSSLPVHFQVSAARYFSHYLPPVSITPVTHLPPVSLIPVAICHRRWLTPVSLTLAENLPPVSLTPVANLLPVSTTQGELVAKFAAGVVDTGGKFAAGVVDTCGNLPPVSLTPVVHLDLRISPRIFEKIRNYPNVIIRDLGEGDS
jgi:hypothetical protein